MRLRETITAVNSNSCAQESESGADAEVKGDRNHSKTDFLLLHLEQEEPGGTQATAITVDHFGADGGRSQGGGMAADSRGPTNGGGAGGGGTRDGETKSKGDGEDPGDQGGADGAGD